MKGNPDGAILQSSSTVKFDQVTGYESEANCFFHYSIFKHFNSLAGTNHRSARNLVLYN